MSSERSTWCMLFILVTERQAPAPNRVLSATKQYAAPCPVSTNKPCSMYNFLRMPWKQRRRAHPAHRFDPIAVSNGLGSRLRLARERKDISVRGLARRVGVSPSLVSQIERGHVMPSVGTLYSIANELQLLLDDLFKDAESGRSPGDRAKSRGAAPSPVQ